MSTPTLSARRATQLALVSPLERLFTIALVAAAGALWLAVLPTEIAFTLVS
jgi:hypothetical protein